MPKIFKKILFLAIILILVFLAISYYNFRFLKREKEKILREQISNLCQKYKTFKSKISCQEALELVLTKYPGKTISSIKPLPQFPNNPYSWLIMLEGNGTPIEVFVTKDKNIIPKK
jgi:hypothetical protein